MKSRMGSRPRHKNCVCEAIHEMLKDKKMKTRRRRTKKNAMKLGKTHSMTKIHPTRTTKTKTKSRNTTAKMRRKKTVWSCCSPHHYHLHYHRRSLDFYVSLVGKSLVAVFLPCPFSLPRPFCSSSFYLSLCSFFSFCCGLAAVPFLRCLSLCLHKSLFLKDHQPLSPRLLRDLVSAASGHSLPLRRHI